MPGDAAKRDKVRGVRTVIIDVSNRVKRVLSQNSDPQIPLWWPSASPNANLSRRTAPIEVLPGELLEEIASYLPPGCFSALALVSKQFGTQFRFRHVASGTQRAPLFMFDVLAREPAFGGYTTHLCLHDAFFGPPTCLQARRLEDHQVDAISRRYLKEKVELLEAVLRACYRLRSLVCRSSPRLRLRLIVSSPKVVDAILERGNTSLRHLDVPWYNTLVPLGKTLLSVKHLTLREGECTGDIKLALMCASFPNLDSLRLVSTCFSRKVEICHWTPFFTSLPFASLSLKRLEFDRCINLPEIFLREGPVKHIPVIALLQNRQADPAATMQFLPPVDPTTTLDHLTCFIYSPYDAQHGGLRLPINLWPGLSYLSKLVQAAPNLRVFALRNGPFLTPPLTAEGYLQEYYEEDASYSLPVYLRDALLQRRLVSLTVQGLRLAVADIKAVCESMPTLVHFSVQFTKVGVQLILNDVHLFSKLPSLLALDVSLALGLLPEVLLCVCGHKKHTHEGHIPGGTAMIWLTRLFGPTQPNPGPALVRMQTAGLPIGRRGDLQFWWNGEASGALQRLETRCGLFQSEEEAKKKVFDPMFWVDM